MPDIDDVEVEVPSYASALASVISGESAGGYSAIAKSVTFRLPISEFVAVDAMAAVSKKSRSYMLCSLIEAGLEQVQKELSKTVLKKLRAEERRIGKAVLAEEGLSEENE